MSKVLILLFFLVGCHSKKEVINKINISQKENLETCPDDGKCTIEIIKNKSIQLKKDEFGLTYIDFSESKSSLVKYTYKRNNIENYADGNYEEIIYLEINDSINNYTLKNEDLKKVNAIFGRLCFCRGATGYYKIKEGDLNILNKDKKLKVNFSFKINEVPQVIEFFNENIVLSK